jgi:hypothetical protein
MIRCAWCGVENYAIDSWCAGCSRHLDWPPPSRAVTSPAPPPPVAAVSAQPRHPPRRPRLIVLASSAAALGAAMALALLAASWFSAAGGTRPVLPTTALRPASPVASSIAAPAQRGPTPDATPTPDVTPTPEATPGENATQPVVPAQPAPAVGDPALVIARFYQAVSGHDFAGAAALWSSRMQARYPPAVYIDHRFAATQQINLTAAQIVGNRGGEATVYVRVVEVLDGQTRHWVGTWQLVTTESGWLLDRPNLRSGT